MGCGNCNKKKDLIWVEEMAGKTAAISNQAQQVYVETTWRGEIFDFEPLGIKRENIIRIIRLDEGEYKAISIQEQ
jgi:CelD/BcsL family acetyltransferase involved in cellulose biosynthesis